MTDQLPYAKLFFPLLKRIHISLWYCLKFQSFKREALKGDISNKLKGLGIYDYQVLSNLIYSKRKLFDRKESEIHKEPSFHNNKIQRLYEDFRSGKGNKKNIEEQFDNYFNQLYIDEYRDVDILTEKDPVLELIYQPITNLFQNGINTHLSKGLSFTQQDRLGFFPRLSKITIHSFKNSQLITESPNFKGLVLPSPFEILHAALTVPEEPRVSAYPLVLCRSMLFAFLKIHPKQKNIERYESYTVITEDDIIDSLSSFRNYVKIQLRWPDKRISYNTKAGKTNFLLGNVLSMRKVAHFWFSNETELEHFCRVDLKDDYQLIRKKYSEPIYRFRIADAFEDLLEPGEIINTIFGIPLPIRGAELLFHGGLRRTSKGGVVINLHGTPGSGKTSVALALSALLSPLNTKTIYLSLEENTEDLYRRLITLIPEYLKTLDFYCKPQKNTWFYPIRLDQNITLSEFTTFITLLDEDIQRDFDVDNNDEHGVPSVCPGYIVIDNINELLKGSDDTKESEQYTELESFINTCRSLGAVVLMISAEDISNKIQLDYLVDVSIRLRQAGTEEQYEKPTRILQLTKTRHQISRQGSHLFHLSGYSGFRIAPQIPSQMDRKQKIKRILPDKKKLIHTLNFNEKKNSYNDNSFFFSNSSKNEPLIKLYPKSQILIHGYGSSGKAGLGLKIALTPSVERSVSLSEIRKNRYNKSYDRSKVLVISFLYPKEYYDELFKRIYISLESYYPNLISPIIKIKAFFPGYLAAEDFISKIMRELDQAVVEGEPYTAILLDGLHNVALQFVKLQENDMIWPLLYGILSRYNLTVISTFTNFSIDNETSQEKNLSTRNSLSVEDQMLMQKGQIPFVHVLVKASDYYFQLSEATIPKGSESEDKKAKGYILSVKSVMDQDIPEKFLEWDRQELKFIDIYSRSEFQ